MSETTVITPVGCIGNRGVDSKALAQAMEKYCPDALAMDAGSMDCGPWYLGAGKEHSPSMNIDYDLEVIIETGLKARIPVIIGSAGGSGGKQHVDTTVRRIRRIAAEALARPSRFAPVAVHANTRCQNAKTKRA